jgi:hypothetical protein
MEGDTMTETREGWALTSNGRNYRKVTGVKESPRWGKAKLTSNEVRTIWGEDFFDAANYTEAEVLRIVLKNVKTAQERARKQLANAEKDEARLMKRAKGLGA